MLRVILGLVLCVLLVGCLEDDVDLPDSEKVMIDPVDADEIDSLGIGLALSVLDDIEAAPDRVERLANRMLSYVDGSYFYRDCYYYGECYYAPSGFEPQAGLEHEDLDCESGRGSIQYRIDYGEDSAFGVETEERILEMVVDADACDLVVDYDDSYEEVHVPYENAITGFTYIEQGFGGATTLDSGDLLVIHGSGFGSSSTAYYYDHYMRLVTGYYPRYTGYTFEWDDAVFWTDVSVAVALPGALADSTIVVEAMMWETVQDYGYVVDGLGITTSGGVSADIFLEDDYDDAIYELENFYEYQEVLTPITALLDGEIEIWVATKSADIDGADGSEYKYSKNVVGRGSIALDDEDGPVEIRDLELEYELDFDGRWSLEVTGSVNGIGGQEDVVTNFIGFSAATTARAEAREAGYKGPESTEVTGTISWREMGDALCEPTVVTIATLAPLVGRGTHCPVVGALELNGENVVFELGTTLLYGSGVTYGRVSCEDVLTEALEENNVCQGGGFRVTGAE